MPREENNYTFNKDVKNFFDARSASYIKLAKWATNKNLLKVTTSMLQGVEAEKVVDLGCGNGLLLKQFPHVPRKIGIDISQGMLLSVKSRDIQKVCADIHYLPFNNRTIDLALCRQVLQYCDPLRVLQEVRRILKPGGYLHVVQLTDYDEVPDEWYKFWVGLRGVSGRARVSRSKLLEHAANANYIILKEQSSYISVKHEWSNFFEKNRVSPNRQDKVKQFFLNADAEIRRIYDLRVNTKGLGYVRRFSSFLLVQEK